MNADTVGVLRATWGEGFRHQQALCEDLADLPDIHRNAVYVYLGRLILGQLLSV